MKKLLGLVTTGILLGAVSPVRVMKQTENILFESAQMGSDLININLVGGSGNEKALSIIKTSDGGFIVAGSTTSNGTGDIPAHSGAAGLLLGQVSKYDASMNHE